MTSRRRIPIRFIAGRLAGGAEDAYAMLGIDHLSPSAKAKAFYRFRKIHDIKPVPGTRSYPLAPIERAIEGAVEG